MREGWRSYSLSDATVSWDSRRKPVKAAERRAGPYPYWGASGVVDHVDDYLFDHPALLVSEDGENLRTRKTPVAFYVAGQYWVNNHAHVLTARHGFDLRFLAYQVGHAEFSGYLTGSTQPKLTAGSLAKLPVLAPPLAEQQRIAGVLGALDDLIDINCVLARRAASLAAALASTSPGRVPLADLASVADARQFRQDVFVDHFSLPAFDDGQIPERVQGSAIKSGKLLLAGPTVLVSRLNPQTPRIWMAYPSDVPAAASTEFLPLVAATGIAVEEIWAVCAADGFSTQMRARVTGTTGSHQRVGKAAIPGLLVADVRGMPADKRAAMVALVQETHASRVAAAKAAKTRDALLPLLLSGRVHVNATNSLVG